MIIEILNKRSSRYHAIHTITPDLVFNIDRSTPVGNPFPMNSESERDAVCDAYEAYFFKQFAAGQANYSPIKPRIQPFFSKLIILYSIALHTNIYLACWCAPKRCHGETIQRVINTVISSSYNLYNIPVTTLQKGEPL